MGKKTPTVADAVRVASRKLRILPDRKLNERLEWAAGSLAEAYRIGAEEAQGEIVARIGALAVDAEPPHA